MKVSNEMAKFIMSQFVGETSGHMANIPNNPILFTIAQIHHVSAVNPDNLRVEDKKRFADFLIGCGEALKENK